MLLPERSAFNSIKNTEPAALAALADKPGVTQENPPAASSEIMTTSTVVKPEHRLQLKIVFSKYSRIHCYYKLRYSTLFHATSLYTTCLNLIDKKKLKFSQDYLTIICLFLSMKYEEIYPPRLHHITNFFKVPQVDLAIYRQEEKKIFSLLDGDLDVLSPKQLMDQYLLKESSEAHSYAYYLLEISFFDLSIPSMFQLKEICLAILFIMRQTHKLKHDTSEVEKEVTKDVESCAKMIAMAKEGFKTNELEYIQRKYPNNHVQKQEASKMV